MRQRNKLQHIDNQDDTSCNTKGGISAPDMPPFTFRKGTSQEPICRLLKTVCLSGANAALYPHAPAYAQW